LTIEYTKPQKDLMVELAQSVKFVTGRVSILAEYHRSYFVRTGGIRRGVGVTPEELTKIKGAIPDTAPATPRKPRKLLVADLNVGRGGHPSRPHANLAVKLMGERTGAFVAEFAESADDFLWGNLRNYDAVFLNNTLGDLFPTPEHRESFSRFIAEGGGMVANHAASVTATNWDEYGQILGAKGAAHRSTQERVIVKLDDPDNPINGPYNGESFELVDEFFRFTESYSRERVHVLQSIDPDRTDMNQGRAFGPCLREDNDYPVCWVRQHGKGRVFYTTLGHSPYRFWDADFLKHFLAAIQFALGDLEVDTTPRAQISGPKS
jgi:type 1 glutamine amidotransferase